ncbi:MAG: glycosyltransferase family 4 protein [Candidatus Obscuribacterales bacterium]
MRIAQLASSVESVPPRGYGGTEIVVDLLTTELLKQGHEVTLFASGDSKTGARLVSITDKSLRTDPEIPQSRWAAYDMRTLIELEKMAGEFDIIHNHMSWSALPALDRIARDRGVPCITTNHNPVRDYCKDIYFRYGHLPYISISDAYRRLNHPDDLNYVATIYNGINLDSYELDTRRKREFLLFLGRICHDKGTSESIELARRLGLPLKIAGKVDRRDQAYFDEHVKPRLSGKIEYVGEVGAREKQELYSGAIAVTYPINFDEPFGLVMAEALACGTPCLALARGSVREVLSDGETAVIGQSVDELAERFPEIESIKPETCRKRVEMLFSKEKMAASYVDIFQKLLKEDRAFILK